MADTKELETRRDTMRRHLWNDEPAWCGNGNTEVGYFRAPRTLGLILNLLAQEEFSGSKDPSRVYLELYASHRDSGLVEMRSEEEHAYASGFRGPRARRSWRERMKILEDTGFIRVRPRGNQRYGFVMLVHPAVAIHRLRAEGKITDSVWVDTYTSILLESGAVQKFNSHRKTAKGAWIAAGESVNGIGADTNTVRRPKRAITFEDD
jgi:hypothetical protein